MGFIDKYSRELELLRIMVQLVVIGSVIYLFQTNPTQGSGLLISGIYFFMGLWVVGIISELWELMQK